MSGIRHKRIHKKGKTIIAIQIAVTLIKNKYNVDLFIYSFYILKFLTVFRKTVETGMDPRLHGESWTQSFQVVWTYRPVLVQLGKHSNEKKVNLPWQLHTTNIAFY